MASYTAVLMHGRRGGEGTYGFEARDDLMDKTPVRVMRAFMQWLEENAGLGHIDYELNVAIKDAKSGTVMTMGRLIFRESDQPFLCMIRAAD